MEITTKCSLILSFHFDRMWRSRQRRIFRFVFFFKKTSLQVRLRGIKSREKDLLLLSWQLSWHERMAYLRCSILERHNRIIHDSVEVKSFHRKTRNEIEKINFGFGFIVFAGRYRPLYFRTDKTGKNCSPAYAHGCRKKILVAAILLLFRFDARAQHTHTHATAIWKWYLLASAAEMAFMRAPALKFYVSFVTCISPSNG